MEEITLLVQLYFLFQGYSFQFIFIFSHFCILVFGVEVSGWVFGFLVLGCPVDKVWGVWLGPSGAFGVGALHIDIKRTNLRQLLLALKEVRVLYKPLFSRLMLVEILKKLSMAKRWLKREKKASCAHCITLSKLPAGSIFTKNGKSYCLIYKVLGLVTL